MLQSTCSHCASPRSPTALASSISRSHRHARTDSAPATLFHSSWHHHVPALSNHTTPHALVVEAPSSPAIDMPIVEQFGADLAWGASFERDVRLAQVIGTGSYGTVHEGEFDSQVVAVKAMRKGGARNRTTMARFKREAAILESLDGVPQVAQLLAKFETPRFVYLVLEKAHGECLSSFVQKRGRLLSEAQIACVLYECLSVLKACHEQRILHGDIKPANFMLAKPLEDIPVCDINHPEPILKAIDFGCSRTVEPGEHLHELIGSPAYAAPEVHLGHYELPSDIWALGISMFQLVTGQLPFWASYRELESLEWEQLTRAVLMQEIEYVGERWESMSPACRDLCNRLLDRDPATRITAAEALQHQWFADWNCTPSTASEVCTAAVV